MIQGFVLCHPQSLNLLGAGSCCTEISKLRRISCGTAKVDEPVDFSEANDFSPSYASWNSALFETSTILTIWEHADQLIGSDDVAILHTDVQPHFPVDEIWSKVDGWLRENPDRAVGLVAPSNSVGKWDDWIVPPDVKYVPANDPMKLHSFDYDIHVWDLIKRYDPDTHDWAMDTQPHLAYSHQFACTRKAFDNLGDNLYSVVQRLKLRDVGLWTPHMFERLIALYLAKFGGNPVLSTCFWHYSSSGAFGPGELSLYGPRPRQYFKLVTRWGVFKANTR